MYTSLDSEWSWGSLEIDRPCKPLGKANFVGGCSLRSWRGWHATLALIHFWRIALGDESSSCCLTVLFSMKGVSFWSPELSDHKSSSKLTRDSNLGPGKRAKAETPFVKGEDEISRLVSLWRPGTVYDLVVFSAKRTFKRKGRNITSCLFLI